MKQEDIDYRNQKVNELKKNYGLKNRLYHYTSLKPLFEMLKKQELWMGSTLNMNL